MLTKKQLTMVTVNAIVVKMLLTYPRVLIVLSGNAAWINVLYVTLLAILIFGAIRLVYNTDKNIISAAEDAGGNILRITVALIIFIVLCMNVLSLIRVFPEIIKLVLLEDTYEEIIGIVFVEVIALGAVFGIESIARVHELFIPIAAAVFIIFLLLLSPGSRLETIYPVFGKGFFDLFVNGISGLSLFADIIILNILLPYTQTLSDYKHAGTRSIIIGGLAAFAITAAYCLTYVYPASEEFFVPVYQLERTIYFSNFFSRFEAVFQFVWTISIFLYGSFYIAVLAKVWEQGFRQPSSAVTIAAIAAILIGTAAIPDSVDKTAKWEVMMSGWIYIPVFLLPILIGIIHTVRYRNKMKK